MRTAMAGMMAAGLFLTGPVAQAQTPPTGQRASVQSILAAERGETPEVRALVAGKDPNARDKVHRRTALMWSIFLNDRAAFDRLLATPGAAVNARDDGGETALLQAAEFAMKYDTAPLVEALIAKGADPKLYSEGQAFTPLMHAANGNAPEVARALLAKLSRKDLELRNAEGMTALSIGAAVGASDVVRLLLEQGAILEATDDASKSALMHAAGHQFPGSLATVALLLNKGANPNAHDKDGNTPLSEAKRYGAPGVADLLQKSGAKP